ncbi:MAG TPA: 3'(2'),5'-bisphosphate nucleotidase CysQ [Polyangiaceae bacterium]
MSSATLNKLIEIAHEAALIIDEVYKTPFHVDYKGPRDPVTAADRRANALICERLSREFPGVPIVAEESDPDTFAGYQSAASIFFVDPLDGTREFVDQNGEFVVMIGLVEGTRATHAVIHAPVSHTAWAGEVGAGAFVVDAGGNRQPIHASNVAELSDARVVASRSHRSELLERALQFLGARELVTLGSAGLKGARVADGGAEAYISPVSAGKRWDACASDALITAAGGRFTDEFGEPIDYRAASLINDRGVVASNGHVHDALLARLAVAREQYQKPT